MNTTQTPTPAASPWDTTLDKPPRILYLNLNTEYFNAIKGGTKTEEYRQVNKTWTRRIVQQQYDQIEFMLGYPKRGDMSRRIRKAYKGYEVRIMRDRLTRNP